MDELRQRILADGKARAKGGRFLREHGIHYHALATVRRINPDNSIELSL